MRRRDLLRNAALAALGAPFASLLADTPARAEPGVAKYFLLFFTSGTDSAQWSPIGSTPTAIQFRPMNEALAALREDLVIVENLDSYGTASEHFSPAGLTGFGMGASAPFSSIEQHIATGLRAAGVRAEIPFLLLGGNPTQTPSTFFQRGVPLVPIDSPVDAFNVVFGGAALPSEEASLLLRQRRSTLDHVSGELRALRARLGAEERDKLDLHTASVRQLEERLRRREDEIAMNTLACAPVAPSDGTEPLDDARILMSLGIHAMRCDLTRVVAVQFGHHQQTPVHLPEVGSPGDWHNDFLHGDAEPRTRLLALERWLADRFVETADLLKATPAPDGMGTLWDQTLLVWARDMGDGVIHRGDDMRFVFSGGANGFLSRAPLGRYVDGAGEHHQRALLSCAEAMGLVDFAGFGDPTVGGAGRLPLSGLRA
ncbi:MAG: DUF1552 domain-containing protein [Sandaracinaceae bacterium]